MANLFAGHKDEWKALAAVDYFGMFVKAYIPFNAWMNVSYPTLNTDREKINEIKKNSNTFRDGICSLLNASNQQGNAFRGLLGELHDLLESCYINNQDRRITFTDVVLGKNNNNIATNSWRGIGFRVQYGNGSTHQTESLIKNKAGNAIFHLSQNDYDIEGLKSNINFTNDVNANYQSLLLDCYKKVCPYIHENLTTGYDTDDPSSFIVCGSYKFINRPEDIAKGLIEILYNLRNSLFHGELIPNEAANKVYGAAYRILFELIQPL